MKALIVIFVVVVTQLQAVASDYLSCRKDYLKHCHEISWAEVQADDYWCLRFAFDEVSLSCQAVVLRMSADVCLKDTVRICKKGELGQDSRKQCLLNNVTKLSPDCRTYVEKRQKLDEMQIKFCGDDYQTHCPGLKDQALLNCSSESYAKSLLSLGCRKFLVLRFPRLLTEFPEVKNE